MEIKISELQELISKQKQLAGSNFYGAFKDGYFAALDIVNTYLKMNEPKCDCCGVVLDDDEEKDDGDTCNRCYKIAYDEHIADSVRER